MNARQSLLNLIRVAGYHNDTAAYTRMIIENRISQKAALEAWHVGKKQKAAGVRCECWECVKVKGAA